MTELVSFHNNMAIIKSFIIINPCRKSEKSTHTQTQNKWERRHSLFDVKGRKHTSLFAYNIGAYFFSKYNPKYYHDRKCVQIFVYYVFCSGDTSFIGELKVNCYWIPYQFFFQLLLCVCVDYSFIDAHQDSILFQHINSIVVRLQFAVNNLSYWCCTTVLLDKSIKSHLNWKAQTAYVGHISPEALWFSSQTHSRTLSRMWTSN